MTSLLLLAGFVFLHQIVQLEPNNTYVLQVRCSPPPCFSPPSCGLPSSSLSSSSSVFLSFCSSSSAWDYHYSRDCTALWGNGWSRLLVIMPFFWLFLVLFFCPIVYVLVSCVAFFLLGSSLSSSFSSSPLPVFRCPALPSSCLVLLCLHLLLPPCLQFFCLSFTAFVKLRSPSAAFLFIFVPLFFSSSPLFPVPSPPFLLLHHLPPSSLYTELGAGRSS